MNSLFKCPVCRLTFNLDERCPITTPCKHIICRSCLIKSSSNQTQSNLKCPIDSTNISVDINNLSISHSICDLIDEKSTKTKSLNQKIFLCKFHPNKQVKFKCCSDDQNLCEDCLISHKKHKIEEISLSSKFFF